ncbi:hypothetical protein GB937_007036 [Aspergillus fischeri]|nr:hypothetical protein GB937_007036 [Aspergillus fischeri]
MTWAETLEKKREKKEKEDGKFAHKREARKLRAVVEWKKNLPCGNTVGMIGWNGRSMAESRDLSLARG